MYSLYQTTTDHPVSKSKYKEIFNTFNYSFHVPKKDRCNECCAFDNNIMPTAEDSERHESHKHKKKLLEQSITVIFRLPVIIILCFVVHLTYKRC